MGENKVPERSLRAATAALTLALVALFTGGCAAHAYAGVPFAAGAADPDVQALAMRAQAGDKQAQLELGIRYEEGRGVARDLGRAELYRLAGTDNAGTVYAYIPPAGRHGQGRVTPLTTGPRQSGLNEARARLAALQGQSGQPLAAPSPVAVARPWRPASGARQNDSGYRLAERVLASALDIRGNRRNYVERLVGQSPEVTCLAPNRCTYKRRFDISVGPKSELVLFFTFNLSPSGVVECSSPSPGALCELNAFVFDAGDEAPPRCVRIDPVRRAATRYGWRIMSEWDPAERGSILYTRLDDSRFRLFIRTLGNSECFRSIYMVMHPTN